MSSSLELKEVSFMSCYGTRRLCLSGVMRSGLGEQGEQGAGPSPGGDQQWGSQSSFCVSAVGCVFGNYPPLTMSTGWVFQERSQLDWPTEECTTHRQQRLTPHSAAEMPDWGRHCTYMKPFLVRRACDAQICTIWLFGTCSAEIVTPSELIRPHLKANTINLRGCGITNGVGRSMTHI